ncbi:hypothetical protein [Ferrimonas marina]|uniref:Uncharacterized protein n=1 Tax=Ferrimonas marina TaxID=299255 RepID=A0A1M5UGZ4_9GAMM|nr:hypothetical protein [Ferrimonas marina]SHH62096.1 hypothetical protein SAMN02745129_2561 [Ferrimonas marina]
MNRSQCVLQLAIAWCLNRDPESVTQVFGRQIAHPSSFDVLTFTKAAVEKALTTYGTEVARDGSFEMIKANGDVLQMLSFLTQRIAGVSSADGTTYIGAHDAECIILKETGLTWRGSQIQPFVFAEEELGRHSDWKINRDKGIIDLAIGGAVRMDSDQVQLVIRIA